MSLVLNMVGGGGSFTATDAILRVQAPANSIVTISKGATTKTDLGHENKDRPTTYDYYFIIHQSQFDSVNAWTVTATRGTESNSTTIIINASDEYDVSIGYHVPLQTYQEVEYLRATGTQYINLGFKATGTSEFDIDFLTENQFTTATGHGWMFGTRNAIATANFGLSTYPLNNAAGTFVYGTASSVTSLGHNPYIVLNQRMQASFRSLHFVTSTGADEMLSQMTFTQTYNQVLFALRTENNKIESPMKGNIYSVKFWSDSNTLIRELYPCYRLSDSVAGMYDKANDVFYTNAGSGTFTVGADV